MITFTYVEEYLEVIGGYLDPVTRKAAAGWMYSFSPIISLARYDVKVLESMTEAVTAGKPLTERQADLACKIILKYQRQLAQKLVDVSPVNTPVFRVPLRKLDYTRRAILENDTIVVTFPFVEELIEQIRTWSKTSQGRAHWNHDLKRWEIAVTEYNVSWIVAWCELHHFNIGPGIRELMDLVLAVEKSDYKLELVIDGACLRITNSADTLNAYIEEHCGGFGIDNLLQLADQSAHLGFDLSTEISEAISETYGARFLNLLVNREARVNPNTISTSKDFASIIDYADATHRWPVVVYEPDLSNRMLVKLMEITQDYQLNNKKNPNIDPTVKYIHTTVPIRNMERMPLVISSAGMVFGGDKQIMLQRAEKVVYCAADVYNKKQTGRKVTKL